MPEKLKLIYFPVNGRAGALRLIAAIGGLHLEEEVLPFREWPEKKSTFPFGSVPVLEVNGDSIIPQHIAICRYLARLGSLNGKDALEDAQIDAIVDGCNELWSNWFSIMPSIVMNGPNEEFKALLKHRLGAENAAKYEGNKELQAECFKKYETNDLNPMLDKFEKMLEKNSSGWFVGNKMTWCDIYVADFLNRVKTLGVTKLDSHSKVKQLVDNVYKNPAVVQFLEHAPKNWII